MKVHTKVQAFVLDAEGNPQVDAEGKKIAAPSQETDLTINWDGMTPEDIKALASGALVVKLQNGWRKNGIPASCTVNAVDHKVGVRTPKAPPVTIESLIEQAKSDPAKKAELIARLQAA